jgi:dUTP pyrophosphatase
MVHTNKIAIGIIKMHEDVREPEYQTDESSGADVRYYCEGDEKKTIFIEPGKRAMIPTGLRFEIPENSEIQVRSRSGLAAKHGICVLNSPGTIDCDYTGELKIILQNHGDEIYQVIHGDRVAQIIVAAVNVGHFYISTGTRGTARGDGGFGSTGV